MLFTELLADESGLQRALKEDEEAPDTHVILDTAQPASTRRVQLTKLLNRIRTVVEDPTFTLELSSNEPLATQLIQRRSTYMTRFALFVVPHHEIVLLFPEDTICPTLLDSPGFSPPKRGMEKIAFPKSNDHDEDAEKVEPPSSPILDIDTCSSPASTKSELTSPSQLSTAELQERIEWQDVVDLGTKAQAALLAALEVPRHSNIFSLNLISEIIDEIIFYDQPKEGKSSSTSVGATQASSFSTFVPSLEHTKYLSLHTNISVPALQTVHQCRLLETIVKVQLEDVEEEELSGERIALANKIIDFSFRKAMFEEGRSSVCGLFRALFTVHPHVSKIVVQKMKLFFETMVKEEEEGLRRVTTATTTGGGVGSNSEVENEMSSEVDDNKPVLVVPVDEPLPEASSGGLSHIHHLQMAKRRKRKLQIQSRRRYQRAATMIIDSLSETVPNTSPAPSLQGIALDPILFYVTTVDFIQALTSLFYRKDDYEEVEMTEKGKEEEEGVSQHDGAEDRESIEDFHWIMSRARRQFGSLLTLFVSIASNRKGKKKEEAQEEAVRRTQAKADDDANNDGKKTTSADKNKTKDSNTEWGVLSSENPEGAAAEIIEGEEEKGAAQKSGPEHQNEEEARKANAEDIKKEGESNPIKEKGGATELLSSSEEGDEYYFDESSSEELNHSTGNDSFDDITPGRLNADLLTGTSAVQLEPHQGGDGGPIVVEEDDIEGAEEGPKVHRLPDVQHMRKVIFGCFSGKYGAGRSATGGPSKASMMGNTAIQWAEGIFAQAKANCLPIPSPELVLNGPKKIRQLSKRSGNKDTELQVGRRSPSPPAWSYHHFSLAEKEDLLTAVRFLSLCLMCAQSKKEAVLLFPAFSGLGSIFEMEKEFSPMKQKEEGENDHSAKNLKQQEKQKRLQVCTTFCFLHDNIWDLALILKAGQHKLCKIKQEDRQAIINDFLQVQRIILTLAESPESLPFADRIAITTLDYTSAVWTPEIQAYYMELFVRLSVEEKVKSNSSSPSRSSMHRDDGSHTASNVDDSEFMEIGGTEKQAAQHSLSSPTECHEPPVLPTAKKAHRRSVNEEDVLDVIKGLSTQTTSKIIISFETKINEDGDEERGENRHNIPWGSDMAAAVAVKSVEASPVMDSRKKHASLCLEEDSAFPTSPEGMKVGAPSFNSPHTPTETPELKSSFEEDLFSEILGPNVKEKASEGEIDLFAHLHTPEEKGVKEEDQKKKKEEDLPPGERKKEAAEIDLFAMMNSKSVDESEKKEQGEEKPTQEEISNKTLPPTKVEAEKGTPSMQQLDLFALEGPAAATVQKEEGAGLSPTMYKDPTVMSSSSTGVQQMEEEKEKEEGESPQSLSLFQEDDDKPSEQGSEGDGQQEESDKQKSLATTADGESASCTKQSLSLFD